VSPSIRVATYNLWFQPDHFEARTAATLAILEAHQCDVICLQEVTPAFLERLLSAEWVRGVGGTGGYSASHVTKPSLGVMKYATVMLARLPCRGYTSHDLPSFMDRKLIVGRFVVDGKVMNVATVHLESEKQVASRQQQMGCLKEWLDERGEPYLIAGDFNFGTGAVENDSLALYNWRDGWAECRANSEPGYTRYIMSTPPHCNPHG